MHTSGLNHKKILRRTRRSFNQLKAVWTDSLMIISASTSLTTWFEGIARLPNETLPQQSPQKKPDNTWNTFLARVNGYYTVIYPTYPYNTRNLQENLTSIRPAADSASKFNVRARIGRLEPPPPLAVHVQIWGRFHYTQQNTVWFREEGR